MTVPLKINQDDMRYVIGKACGYVNYKDGFSPGFITMIFLLLTGIGSVITTWFCNKGD